MKLDIHRRNEIGKKKFIQLFLIMFVRKRINN